MAVTLTVRFPHGLYHATAWDSAPNSGDVEWPPSPWRLARALLSAWYTRVPHLEPDVIMAVLDVLREPPSYWLPPVTSEHTRHYLPQPGHRQGDEGAWDTTMTLDPSVYVDPKVALVIHWPETEVDPRVRRAMEELVHALPYLGRAESVCEAALLDESYGVDELALDATGWCVPDESGVHRTLCLGPDTTREQLEVRPDQVRNARLRKPSGSRWVPYTDPVRSPDLRRPAPSLPLARQAAVTVLRWRLSSTAPFLAENGVMATEGLRQSRLTALGPVDGIEPALSGHLERDEDNGRPTAFDGHGGAHWLWVEGGDRADAAPFGWIGDLAAGSAARVSRRVVRDVALWVPSGIPDAHLHRLVAGLGEGGLLRPSEYTPAGYVPAELHLVGIGTAAQCLPELTSEGAVEWVSATPFLTTRHRRKNQSFIEFLDDSVRREANRRNDDPHHLPQIAEVACLDDRFDPHAGSRARRGWASAYRQRRWLLPQAEARRRRVTPPTYQAMVRIRFEAPTRGPVSLGGLSHFGFGLFVPMSST